MGPSATADEIRAAYRRLARRHHPDTAGEGSARMAELNEAYAVLRDPARRARYDAELRARQAGPAPSSAPAAPPAADDADAEFVPVGRLHPGRWGIPALWLAVLGALLAIFVFSAYATTGGRQDQRVDGLLRPGSCVDLDPAGYAREVPCSAAHDGRVVLLPPLDASCPAGSRTYGDRNAMGKVCVEVR